MQDADTAQLITRVGQNYIYIYKYTVYIYGNFGRENTKYTVIYGAYIRFWQTLLITQCHYHHAVWNQEWSR